VMMNTRLVYPNCGGKSRKTEFLPEIYPSISR